MSPREVRDLTVIGLSGLVVSVVLLLRGETVALIPAAATAASIMVFLVARRWRRDE